MATIFTTQLQRANKLNPTPQRPLPIAMGSFKSSPIHSLYCEFGFAPLKTPLARILLEFLCLISPLTFCSCSHLPGGLTSYNQTQNILSKHLTIGRSTKFLCSDFLAYKEVQNPIRLEQLQFHKYEYAHRFFLIRNQPCLHVLKGMFLDHHASCLYRWAAMQ